MGNFSPCKYHPRRPRWSSGTRTPPRRSPPSNVPSASPRAPSNSPSSRENVARQLNLTSRTLSNAQTRTLGTNVERSNESPMARESEISNLGANVARNCTQYAERSTRILSAKISNRYARIFPTIMNYSAAHVGRTFEIPSRESK